MRRAVSIFVVLCMTLTQAAYAVPDSSLRPRSANNAPEEIRGAMHQAAAREAAIKSAVASLGGVLEDFGWAGNLVKAGFGVDTQARPDLKEKIASVAQRRKELNTLVYNTLEDLYRSGSTRKSLESGAEIQYGDIVALVTPGEKSLKFFVVSEVLDNGGIHTAMVTKANGIFTSWTTTVREDDTIKYLAEKSSPIELMRVSADKTAVIRQLLAETTVLINDIEALEKEARSEQAGKFAGAMHEERKTLADGQNNDIIVEDPNILRWKMPPKSLEEILDAIVKEYDVRFYDGMGDQKKYPRQVDDELLVWFGRALGSASFKSEAHNRTEALKPGDTFIMGRDNGPSSENIAQDLIKGLTETGVNVILLGECTAGECYRSVSRFNAAGGLYITRSHVEIGTNGFKPIVGNITLYGDMLLALKEQILSGKYRKAQKPGTVDTTRGAEARKMHFDYLKQNYGDLKAVLDKTPMKVAVNLGGGSATAPGYEKFMQNMFGDHLVKVFRAEPDPRCEKGGLPDPSRADDVALSNPKCDIMKWSRENPDVFIFNFDLDADRVSIVKNGVLFPGDSVFGPVAEYVLADYKYKDWHKEMLCDPRMGLQLAQIIEKNGGVAKIHPKGHSKVKATMDVMMSQLAKSKGFSSVAEFMKKYPDFRMYQSEFSLHMFLTNDKGIPADDTIEFMFFWVKAFSSLRQKYNDPQMDLAGYWQNLEKTGVISPVYALPEQRTEMVDAAKKRVMIQMADEIAGYFKGDASFERVDWKNFTRASKPLTLIDVDGVFYFKTPLGVFYWGWSNTSEKITFGAQAANEYPALALTKAMLAVFLNARDKAETELGMKLAPIQSKETAPLLKLFKVSDAAQVEQICRQAYPDTNVALASLAGVQPGGISGAMHAQQRMENFRDGMFGDFQARKKLWEQANKNAGLGPDSKDSAENWTGWITLVPRFMERLPAYDTYGENVVKTQNIIVLGTGGSGLGARMLADFARNSNLRVIDIVDPVYLKEQLEAVPQNAAVIVSSKSGQTTETTTQCALFQKMRPDLEYFAITDGGNTIGKGEFAFRDTILNNETKDAHDQIGGRYSVMSLFGLAPAIFAGIDAEKFIKGYAQEIKNTQTAETEDSVGLLLGEMLASELNRGHNKWTFVTKDPTLESIGWFQQQLVNESLGKRQGAPLFTTGEKLSSDPKVYGKDRLFIQVIVSPDAPALSYTTLSGRPCIVLALKQRSLDELGKLVARLFISTAYVGVQMEVNPFDQPGVEASKKQARAIFDKVEAGEKIASVIGNPSVVTSDKAAFYLGAPELKLIEQKLKAQGKTLEKASGKDVVRALLSSVKEGDYVGLLPYTSDGEQLNEAFAKIRTDIRDNSDAHPATVFGVGSRFQHSDNQLHGSVNNNVLFIITFENKNDIPVPGRKFTFGEENSAMATGTYRALVASGHRVAMVNLPASYRQDLSKVEDLFESQPKEAATALTAFDAQKGPAQLPCARIYSSEFENVLPAIYNGTDAQVKIAIVTDKAGISVPEGVVVAKTVEEAKDRLEESARSVRFESVKYITTKNENVPAGVELVVVAQEIASYLGGIKLGTDELDKLQREIKQLLTNL